MTADQTQQPWKSVWPAPANAPNQAQTIPENTTREEMTNQRAFGSHASNTKGRIVHLKKCKSTSVYCRCPCAHTIHVSNLSVATAGMV